MDLCTSSALPSWEVCDMYAKPTDSHTGKQTLRQTVKIFNRGSDALRDNEEEILYR